MQTEVLVSTMNQKNKRDLINELNINKCTIINQVTEDIIPPKNELNEYQKIVSFKEKGLSKSRNKAIEYATSDICIIADDDMYYESNYEEIILDGYKKYPDADIIAFDVDNEDKKKRKRIFKEKELNIFESMRLSSVQITFKKNSIIKNNIKFDEEFGAGSKYYWGEENIFMFDCKRKKLRIYYIPQKIATLKANTNSTWDRTISKKHMYYQGIIYYRMSKIFFVFFILWFVFRKKSIYLNKFKPLEALFLMISGIIKYKRGLL